ncbi:MAG: hypothetical protein ACFFDT_34280 [Candidatus Hodarchaeota archaeon]
MELHKGFYIFNPEFWENLYDLRKQLNYQTSIFKEITPFYKLSEEKEVELIRKVLKEARERKKKTPEIDPEAERFKESLKEKIRRTQNSFRSEWLLKICVIGSNNDLNQKFGNLTADTTWEIDYLPTTGYDIQKKRIRIEKEQVKLIIMIINSDYYFTQQRKSSYRGSVGCFIVFDKGKKETFEQVNDFYEEYRHIESPIYLVGITRETEEVTTEEGETLANQLGINYVETLIHDREKVEEIMHDLTKEILLGMKESQ